jgi:hypothetical protein
MSPSTKSILIPVIKCQWKEKLTEMVVLATNTLRSAKDGNVR